MTYCSNVDIKSDSDVDAYKNIKSKVFYNKRSSIETISKDITDVIEDIASIIKILKS